MRGLGVSLAHLVSYPDGKIGNRETLPRIRSAT